MKKIRETLQEPWNIKSMFTRSQTPQSITDSEKSEKSEKSSSSISFDKKPLARILSKSPTSHEGFYVVNPKQIDNTITEVFTPLDFDIDALYAVPNKRVRARENDTSVGSTKNNIENSTNGGFNLSKDDFSSKFSYENILCPKNNKNNIKNGGEDIKTVERSYANLSESRYQPLSIRMGGEELHYQVVKPRPIRCKRSKSAQNLHKTELKVYLQRAPSLEPITQQLQPQEYYDVPSPVKRPVMTSPADKENLELEDSRIKAFDEDLVLKTGDKAKLSRTSTNNAERKSRKTVEDLKFCEIDAVNLRLVDDKVRLSEDTVENSKNVGQHNIISNKNSRPNDLNVINHENTSLKVENDDGNVENSKNVGQNSNKDQNSASNVKNYENTGSDVQMNDCSSCDQSLKSKVENIKFIDESSGSEMNQENECSDRDKRKSSSSCKSEAEITTSDNYHDKTIQNAEKLANQQDTETNSTIDDSENYYQEIENENNTRSDSNKTCTSDVPKITVDNQNENCKNIRLGTRLIKIEHLQKLKTEFSVKEKPISDAEIDDLSASCVSYEYCEEKNNINERLLLTRSKTGPLYGVNSAKISKAWRGLKGFLEDEKKRLDKLVAKHSVQNLACNRIAGDRNNKTGVDVVGNKVKGDFVLDGNGEKIVTSDVLVKNEVFFQQLNEAGSTSPKLVMDEKYEGQNGYEDLRRHVKAGGDLNKELATILQERADAELTYAKSLCKLSAKLNRACRECQGGVATALRGVAGDMEARGDVHRQFSSSLCEEVVRPLRQLADTQHRARKSAEGACDKAARSLAEWRSAEAKAKKQSHAAARDNEKLQDASLDARLARAPSLAILHHHQNGGGGALNGGHGGGKISQQQDKDGTRLEGKRKKAEQAVRKADVEYYSLCVRAERARLDWELCVTRGSGVLAALEQQRLTQLVRVLHSYVTLNSQCGPALQQATQLRLAPAVEQCDAEQEMQAVKAIRRSTDGPCEQLLPDFYCEHTTLAMNRERRKQSLVKLLHLVRQDLNREKKSRTGLESLAMALKQTNCQQLQPANNTSTAITQDESHQNVLDKLYHIRCMLLYLEGARYKLHSALCELDHRTRGDHPLAPHLRVTRDRTGLQQSVLRAPAWMRESPPLEGGDVPTSPSPPIGSGDSVVSVVTAKKGMQDEDDVDDDDEEWGEEGGRGAGDGLSNQRDSDYDEFSSQGSFNDLNDTIDGDSTQTLHEMQGDVVKSHATNPVAQIQVSSQVQAVPPTPAGVGGEKEIILGYCKALYEYQPKLYDELRLTPGDVISVLSRQEDGWWVGRLADNRMGIFPATYVQELDNVQGS